MSVKACISLTDAQDGDARALVASGRYPSFSAVLRHGLDLLREETETHAVETAALRALLEERRGGRFLALDEAGRATVALLAAKRRTLGLEG